MKSIIGGDGFGDGGELLEIELDDGVGEEARVLLRVPLRHVHRVRLQHDGGGPAVALVHGGHRPVVPQAVVPADDAESGHAPLVVEDVEPLRAGGRRQTGDDADVTQRADADAEPLPHAAALDEVLVRLGLVEAADDGPHVLRRRVDALREYGGALPCVDPVVVELRHRGLEIFELLRREPGRN